MALLETKLMIWLALQSAKQQQTVLKISISFESCLENILPSNNELGCVLLNFNL